jgi:hypothetical protein
MEIDPSCRTPGRSWPKNELDLQSVHVLIFPISHALNVRNGPFLEVTPYRPRANVLEADAPGLRHAFQVPVERTLRTVKVQVGDVAPFIAGSA